MKRPDCIRHWRELEGPDDATYPDNPERFSIGAPLARGLGSTGWGSITNVCPRASNLLSPCGER
jgi:hypothetical protein